jgi:fibronectin type 3 domain-containing protein
MKKIVLLMSVLLMVVGCGVKKPPVPWESIVPKRIVDLDALPREGRLLLEWSVPKENTDKSPLTDLSEFKLLRSEGALIAGECRGCGNKKEVISGIKVSSQEVKGGKMTVWVEDQEVKKVYVYEVISINRKGYPSSPSNPVSVYWDSPPQAPKSVQGEIGNKRVDLSWEPVNDATGYNIYRREEGGVFALKPLNRESLTLPHYTDLNVENERSYIYSVRAIKRVIKTDVEGKGSLDVALTPIKLIPPGSPVGLVAIPLKGGIELNWRRNQEPDLLGYYVYRRKPGEKEFKRLNKGPLEKETYIDIDAELGQDYEYAVTAVDNSARRNESPLSEEVRVKYIYQ